jgi:hypothetical protein
LYYLEWRQTIYAILSLTGPDGKLKVEVWIAPPGTTSVREDMVPSDWNTATLTPRASQKVLVGKRGHSAFRTQIPLVPTSASTVHKCIGDTCSGGVAICISASNVDFNWWQTEMLLVALSRVTSLKHLHFVSAIGQDAELSAIREDSLLGVQQALNKNSIWTEHVMLQLENLDYLKSSEMRIVTRPRPLAYFQTGMLLNMF